MMSTLSSDLQSFSVRGVEPSPFPAKTKTASGLVNGVQTDVMSMYFSDKILVTISQDGALSQWISTPLPSSPISFDTSLTSNSDSNLLPLNNLNPRTLLGVGGEKREMIGHLYASQIASRIAMRDPEERRTVVVGLGLKLRKEDKETGITMGIQREEYFDLLELAWGVL